MRILIELEGFEQGELRYIFLGVQKNDNFCLHPFCKYVLYVLHAHVSIQDEMTARVEKLYQFFRRDKRLENEQNMGFEECSRGEYLQKNYQIFVLGQFGVTYVIFKDKSM